MRRNKLALLVCFVLLVPVLLGACGARSTIVGRWQFQTVKGSWDYDWMEFFEDGGYTDNWGNSRTWAMVSNNRLKLDAGLAGTYLYDVNSAGDRMEITDEYGNSAIGTRVSGTTPSGSKTSGIVWVLLILLVAGAASIYFIYRRGSQRKAVAADAVSPTRSASSAFCMHCGQPVQAGSKFCLHCGKPLA